MPHSHSVFFLSFCLVLFFGLPALAHYQVRELRQALKKAQNDAQAGDRFVRQMEGYKGQDPVLLGYKAAAQAIQAKYVRNPVRKLRSIRQSAATFEQAVGLNPSEPELRFLRYSVESNTPGMLNLSAHTAQDKAFLIRSLQQHPRSGLDDETYSIVREFLLMGEELTERERVAVRNLKP
ncbi:hypothetical protein BH24BAC1_BH24BAC1_31150 [soil metagenome]